MRDIPGLRVRQIHRGALTYQVAICAKRDDGLDVALLPLSRLVPLNYLRATKQVRRKLAALGL